MVLEIFASSLFDATRSAGLHRVFVRQHTLPQVRLPKQWRLCSRSFFTESFQSAESADYSLCTMCADSAVFGCISFSAAFLFVPRGFVPGLLSRCMAILCVFCFCVQVLPYFLCSPSQRECRKAGAEVLFPCRLSLHREKGRNEIGV